MTCLNLSVIFYFKKLILIVYFIILKYFKIAVIVDCLLLLVEYIESYNEN